MSADRSSPNAIEVNGTSMLLTTTSGGTAVHLTATAPEPGTGRQAVYDFHVDRDARAAAYDREALTEPRWKRTTLCGRQWAVMVGGEGGAIGRFGKVALAPTCRRCLAIIDRQFPEPVRDPRLPFVAQVAADAVVDHRGIAEIHDVPGDQQAELRRMVRTLVRERTGHQVRTHAYRGVVYVECQAIYNHNASNAGGRPPMPWPRS